MYTTRSKIAKDQFHCTAKHQRLRKQPIHFSLGNVEVEYISVKGIKNMNATFSWSFYYLIPPGNLLPHSFCKPGHPNLSYLCLLEKWKGVIPNSKQVYTLALTNRTPLFPLFWTCAAFWKRVYMLAEYGDRGC